MLIPKSLLGSRIIAIIFLSVFLTACSIADYQKPVADFSAATNKVEATLIELNKQVTDAYRKILLRRALTSQNGVQFYKKGKDVDCHRLATRCRLVFYENEQEKSLSPKPALQKIIALARSFRAYANNLSAIVEADTAAQVEVSTNETLASIERLEDTVRKFSKKPKTSAGKIKEYTLPVGLVINWVVEKYVAEVKIDALKHATENAKDIVADAAKLFQSLAEIGKDKAAKKVLASDVQKYHDKLVESKSKQDLEILIKATKQYDELLLLSSRSNIFAMWSDAHNVLANKLEGEKISLATLYVKISALLEEAEKLAAIAKAFAEARR